MTALAVLAPSSDDIGAVQKSALSLYVGVMAGIAEYLNEPGSKDPEILIKLANSKLADVARVIPEKKTDPYANLATINVTFVNGAMRATVQVAPANSASIEAEDALDMSGLQPSAAMVAMASINDDIDLDVLEMA